MKIRYPALFSVIAAVSVAEVSAQTDITLSQATQDAMVHVITHEVGHAVLREFDLPIFGPEEDIADDFATIYVYLTLPDRAEAIVTARARQNMADGQQTGMFSEYRSDDQRAGRSICVLYGLDPERYGTLASTFGLEGEEAAACRDFAPEVGRSWRRVLADYRMPADARVTEVGLLVDDDSAVAQAFAESGALEDLYRLMSGIDWHSRITLNIAECDGSAGWSRNGREITVCDAYIARFEDQLGG